MHPNSTVLLILLVLLGIGALVLLRRARRRAVGVLAGVLAFVLAATTGMAA